jgi:hypothetical protein
MDGPNKAYIGPSATSDYTAATGDHGSTVQSQHQQNMMMGGHGLPNNGMKIVGGGGMSVAGSVMTATHNPMVQPRPPPAPAFYRICGCIEIYQPSREVLEYDYTYDDTNGKKPPQNYPRIRERGEYYIDSYNSEPWSCTFGTAERVRF